MKIQRFFSAILIILSSYNYSLSQVSENYTKLDLRNKISGQSSSLTFEKKINLVDLKQSSKKKSPFLGALFSGIIPGSGEVYAKSYLKAALFVALEAGLWTAYSIFQKKGNDQTDLYQGFADQNWSVNKYAQWLVEQQFNGYTAITDPQSSDLNRLRREINQVEGQNFSHQLPPFGDQQYYELIGKYQNFVAGWADADISTLNKNPGTQNYYGTYKTAMFENYSFDRQKANDYYDNSSTTLIAVIFNHVLSAADAAWSVSMFNKSLKISTNMRLDNMYSFNGKKSLIPFTNLNVTF